MKLVVASHPGSFDHDTGPGHPERPERVTAVMAGLESSGLELVRMESPAVDRVDLVRVHNPDYVDFIDAFCRVGGGHLDGDTVVSPESWDAALRSAGAVTMLVDEVETRSGAFGFAVTRPPGHHALPARGMGFCLFNNVAVAAARIRARGQTVAIVDWDVHHGNGTQAMLASDEGVLYVSIHQWPLYPHEGERNDIDSGAPGTTINIPLPPGTGGDIYRAAFTEIVSPVVEKFEPDWLLISAGYDAHVSDILADMALETPDFGWMASSLAAVFPVDRVVLALEGGYDLEALRGGAEATVRGLAGEVPGSDPLPSPTEARSALDAAVAAVRRHWPV